MESSKSEVTSLIEQGTVKESFKSEVTSLIEQGTVRESSKSEVTSLIEQGTVRESSKSEVTSLTEKESAVDITMALQVNVASIVDTMNVFALVCVLSCDN